MNVVFGRQSREAGEFLYTEILQMHVEYVVKFGFACHNVKAVFVVFGLNRSSIGRDM